MKRIMALLLAVLMLFTFAACTDKDLDSDKDSDKDSKILHGVEGKFPGAPTLILNGEELDAFTSHYHVKEEYAAIPLSAFLQSVGAEYADSPLNTYETQCYSFMGKRYVIVGEMHLFMVENDYTAFLKELDKDNKKLSRKTAADRGLLPRNKNKYLLERKEEAEGWAEIWIDHVSLMKALRESGIDITIEYDYHNRTISVTLPQQGN